MARVPESGMVEKRGASYWMVHAGLITGVAIIAFPIWLAFVASTVTQPEIIYFIASVNFPFLTSAQPISTITQILPTSSAVSLGVIFPTFKA